MQPQPLQKIAICGAGLAGLMCAAALARALPENIEIILIDIDGADKSDIFYGTAAPPSAHNFWLDIGLGEPDFFPQSNTSFSLGTDYIDWGSEKRSWMQSFHRPLPILQGVEFHHYLTRMMETDPRLADLGPYIMSVQAARRGVFAHPPQDQNIPLSNVAYGYHFLPAHWRKVLSEKIIASRVNYICSDIGTVQRSQDRVLSIDLTNQTRVDADLFIDCLGPNSSLSPPNISPFTGGRHLMAIESITPKEEIKGVSRTITGTAFGWTSITPLQEAEHKLTLCDLSSKAVPLEAHVSPSPAPVSTIIGRREGAWTANHLAMGHSAACLEPLSPAPIMLLQQDIIRLIELIPVSSDMSVERREYNRRFKKDYAQASDFQRGFFGQSQDIKTQYWNDAIAEPMSAELESKITQFQHRGALVQYDLEPFEKEDWVQLHLGMGREPARYDRLADKVPLQQLSHTLQSIRSANETMAAKLPPHDTYMKKLLQYLRKQNV